MPEETPQIESQGLDGASILDKAVVLEVGFHRWGLSRKASLDGVTVAATKDYLRLSKTLLKCAEYDAVVSYRREITQWLRNCGLPFTLRAGSYLVPLSLVVPVEQTLREKQEIDKTNVATFLAVYGRILLAMADANQIEDLDERDRLLSFLPKTELGIVFRPEDYPSVGEMAGFFSIDWKWLDYGTANRLQQIDAELFTQAQGRLNQQVERFAVDMERGLMGAFAQLVNGLEETLTPKEDGSRKRFYSTTVTKLNEFLSTVDLRNLTGSTQLADLSRQARNLLDGVDPELLRDDDALRAALQTGFGQIRQTLSGLVDTSTRRITVEHETEDEPADDAVAAS
jgi:hypothetical protein